MSIVRQYVLIAAEGRAEALAQALKALAGAVAGIAGCEGGALLRDQGNPQRFVFQETWESLAVYRAAAAQLPPDLFGAVMREIGGKPESATFDAL